MLLPNFNLFLESQLNVHQYLKEEEEELSGAEEELVDQEEEEEDTEDPEGVDMEDPDDLADGDFGQDGGYEEPEIPGQEQESKFNNMNKSEIYSSFSELVKLVSRNSGLKLEGPFDKEMGINFNSSIHNTAFWKLSRKEDFIPVFILTALIDPEKLIEQNTDNPEEEEIEENLLYLEAEETGEREIDNNEEQEEVGSEEEPQEEEINDEGEFTIEVYNIETKQKKKLKANVDIVSDYINEYETKVLNKKIREREKELKHEKDALKPKKYFI